MWDAKGGLKLENTQCQSYSITINESEKTSLFSYIVKNI